MPIVDTSVQEFGAEPSTAAAGAEPEEVLRRAVAVQQRLAQPALEGRGMDAIAAAIAAVAGGSVLVLGPAAAEIARHDPGGVLDGAVATDLARDLAARGAARPCILVHPALPGGAYARPVPAPRGARAEAWVVVATFDGRLDELVRLVVRQAVTIVGLELRHGKVVGKAERRLTAGLVADAIAGETDPAELARRLRAFQISGDVAVIVFAIDGAEPVLAEVALQGALAGMGVAVAVSTQEIEGRELLCAVVEPGDRDPVALAVEVRERLAEEIDGSAAGIAAAVSRARPAAGLSHVFQEAYWALGAVEHRRAGEGEAGAGRIAGAAPADGDAASAVGSWEDLGVESLLLSVADQDVLHLYCDRLLGPVLASDSLYSAELLRSLELFILHNGQWERAARELHCHRHTLRYRIRKVEEMTGRDLGKATDRIEFWLALRAHELAAPAGRRGLPA